MFGFLKPGVSGFKNVLNGYFDFKAKTGILEDNGEDILKTVAVFVVFSFFSFTSSLIA